MPAGSSYRTVVLIPLDVVLMKDEAGRVLWSVVVVDTTFPESVCAEGQEPQEHTQTDR